MALSGERVVPGGWAGDVHYQSGLTALTPEEFRCYAIDVPSELGSDLGARSCPFVDLLAVPPTLPCTASIVHRLHTRI